MTPKAKQFLREKARLLALSTATTCPGCGEPKPAHEIDTCVGCAESMCWDCVNTHPCPRADLLVEALPVTVMGMFGLVALLVLVKAVLFL